MNAFGQHEGLLTITQQEMKNRINECLSWDESFDFQVLPEESDNLVAKVTILTQFKGD